MMSCKCDLRTRAVGDGCRYCNPQHYIDILEDQTKDDCSELDKLEETIRQQQAEIDRLTEQRDRLLSVCVKASAFFPQDKKLDQLDVHPLNSIRLSMAEIGDAARSVISSVSNEVCTRSHPHEDMTETCKLLSTHAKDLYESLIGEIEAGE